MNWPRLKLPAARAALALPTGRTTALRQNLRGMSSLLRFKFPPVMKKCKGFQGNEEPWSYFEVAISDQRYEVFILPI